MDWSLAIVAAAVLAVAAISARLTDSPLTPSLAFMALGLLLGNEVLGGLDISSSDATVRTLAEAALTLVLFTDAARIGADRA